MYVLRGLAVSSHPVRFSSSSMCLFCHARTPYHRRPLLFLSSAPPNLTCPLSRLSGTCAAEMGRSWEVVQVTGRGERGGTKCAKCAKLQKCTKSDRSDRKCYQVVE